MPTQKIRTHDAVSQYERSLREVATGLWSGALDYDQAFDSMFTTIQRNLTAAWYEGLAEAGIQPSEMSEEEKMALRSLIVTEQSRMTQFLSYCEEHSKANGGKLGECTAKASMWAKRAQEAKNKALLMAKSDPKLKWSLGHTEKHCGTCAKLDGKVKRASYWAKIGVEPQNPPNPFLECEGWNCGCGLSPTDDPMSKGPLPALP